MPPRVIGVVISLPLGALRVYSTVFEDESNRLPKVTPSIFLRSSLTVGAWNFRTMGYVPFAVFLDDGSKLIQQFRLPQSILSIQPQFEGKISSRHPGHVE